MDANDRVETVTSRSGSSSSSHSDLDKDIGELDLNGSIITDEQNGDDENGGTTSSNGSLILINKNNTLKKRISSSRTPTRKAKRVRFYRNGDRFYGGIVIPVSNERYRYGMPRPFLFFLLFFVDGFYWLNLIDSTRFSTFFSVDFH